MSVRDRFKGCVVQVYETLKTVRASFAKSLRDRVRKTISNIPVGNTTFGRATSDLEKFIASRVKSFTETILEYEYNGQRVRDWVVASLTLENQPIEWPLRTDTVRTLLGTERGRHNLARSFTEPVRCQIGALSLARRCLREVYLPEGASTVYRNPEGAFVLSDDFENVLYVPSSERNRRRVYVPLSEMDSVSEHRLTELRSQNFDSVLNAPTSMGLEIAQKENQAFVKLLDAASRDSQTFRGIRPLSSEVLADAFAAVEKQRKRVAFILMNYNLWSDFRKHGREIIEFETQEERLARRYLGKLWGADICASPCIPDGEVYVLAEPGELGVMPIQNETTVLSYDVAIHRLVGFVGFERLGMFIRNPKLISRVIMSARDSE